MKSSDLLIIIPAYNEEGSIENVVDNIIRNYSQYDYVIINDGSKDRTSAICHANGYNIVDLPVNLGLAGAFQTGLRYAYEQGYKKAVQFDADGQHLPEYISVLEAKMCNSDCNLSNAASISSVVRHSSYICAMRFSKSTPLPMLPKISSLAPNTPLKSWNF